MLNSCAQRSKSGTVIHREPLLAGREAPAERLGVAYGRTFAGPSMDAPSEGYTAYVHHRAAGDTAAYTEPDEPEQEEDASEDRILLQGMMFHGRHGTLPAERELGQPFVVDVELRLDLRPAGASDDLTKTVDYAEVHRIARKIVDGEPVGLIETLADRIAAAILEYFTLVEATKVKVSKPHVRLGDTVLAGSAVEILRPRDFDPAR